MTHFTYTVPRQITCGHGALDTLATLIGKRAAIVTGSNSMKTFGFLDKAASLLKRAGIDSIVIDGVEPNPSVETVWRGAKAMLDFQPDWIVAIGGGSAIDAAKVMWCFYEHPHLTFEDIIPVGAMPPLRQKARFAAVPSTSGTASEITAFSVITDTVKHIKYPIVAVDMVPDIAILDPALPATMPKDVTAHTGMDVMAHAIEAIASTAATPLTDATALEAIKLVVATLPVVQREPDNLPARLAMHQASALAGMAFSNASLGLVHALAHAVGAVFGLAHGQACAILLPHVIDYNRTFSSKYARVEEALGIADLAERVRALSEELGLASRFIDLIDERCFNDRFDDVCHQAYADPCRFTNPGEPDLAAVKQILARALHGQVSS